MLSISGKIKELLQNQKKSWELVTQNYAALDKVLVREVLFDGFTIKIQFNPERIRSSAAKTDRQSIAQRPCFLCPQNRPKKQQEFNIGSYSILTNPYPVFPEHFTITEKNHTPQRLQGRFSDMLDLAQAMNGFTLFYNGPQCGASAPDHFHFQAGTQGIMPINNEIKSLENKYGKKLSPAEGIWGIQDGFRNFILLESEDKNVLKKTFNRIYSFLKKISGAKDEPMMNVLASFQKRQWKIFIFPRNKQRPSQYYAEGEDNILVSPASVEMGGLLITPLEKDFNKITATDIRDIYQQVLYNDNDFNLLIQNI